MNETELVAAIERELDNALGSDSGDLTDNRAKAWDYFLGEPIGGEQEGRSQVISTDLSDVVDWIMPDVLRAFGSGEAAVEFSATNEQDEAAAEAESKIVNHVFFKENGGLLLLHNWFQEAFLQKNGYIKPSWDDTPEYETIELEGLTPEQVEAIKQNPDIEIESHEEIEETVQTDMGEISSVTANLTIRRVVSKGRLLIETVPANEARVNADHKDVTLQTARFAAHEREVTASELVEMGYDRKLVDSLPSYDDDDDEIENARNNILDEQDDDEPADPSQKKIKLTEAYWLVDADDDGIAERRMVHYAGKQFLQNEEVKRVRLISITPFPLANKHLGRSLYDKVRQIMDIKTALWRQIIDNLFLINNSRHAVVEGQVRISDMLNSRPGGIVRQKQPGMIEPLKTPPIGVEVYQFLEYLDKARDERTGVGPETTAELGQLANTTAWGVERLMSKKEELVGLVIAIFRSTGVNELFEQIHELLRENADGPMTVPVDGAWMSADPRSWRKRSTVPSVTWSGMGDRIEKKKALFTVMQWQKEVLSSPMMSWMVQPKHIHESMSDYVKASGLNNFTQYAVDPSTQEGQQALMRHVQSMQGQGGDTDALAKMEQVKGQYRAQIEQLKESNRRDIEALKAKQKQMSEQREYKEHLDNLQFKYDELEQRFVEQMTQIEAEFAKQIPHGVL